VQRNTHLLSKATSGGKLLKFTSADRPFSAKNVYDQQKIEFGRGWQTDFLIKTLNNHISVTHE